LSLSLKFSAKSRAETGGQATTEYLLACLWAIILIIIIVISKDYLPYVLLDKCTLETGFTCGDFSIRSGSSMSILKVYNSLGKDVRVIDVTFSAENLTFCSMDILAEEPTGFLVKSGQSVVFDRIDCEPDISTNLTNKKLRFDVRVSHYAVGSNPDFVHNVNGAIFGRIEP
jgi:hypothetical protein